MMGCIADGLYSSQAFVQLPTSQLKHELFHSQRLDELNLPHFNAVREQVLSLCVSITDTKYRKTSPNGTWARHWRSHYQKMMPFEFLVYHAMCS